MFVFNWDHLGVFEERSIPPQEFNRKKEDWYHHIFRYPRFLDKPILQRVSEVGLDQGVECMKQHQWLLLLQLQMLADGKFQCFADRFVIEILHHQLIERTCDTKKPCLWRRSRAWWRKPAWNLAHRWWIIHEKSIRILAAQRINGWKKPKGWSRWCN